MITPEEYEVTTAFRRWLSEIEVRVKDLVIPTLYAEAELLRYANDSPCVFTKKDKLHIPRHHVDVDKAGASQVLRRLRRLRSN